MSTLIIFMKIPLPVERLVWTPNLTFTQWLPLEERNGIHIVEGDISLNLWFNLGSLRNYGEGDLHRMLNILVKHINATISVKNLDTEIASYIQNRDFSRKPYDSEKQLQDEYDKLGILIYDLLITKVNRFIDYVRVFKGQYWLFNLPNDHDRVNGFYNSCESTGQVNEGDKFRFTPGVGDTFQIEMTPTERYIAENDWESVKKFVEGHESPPLVLELISEAEQLKGYGYTPSALTEAVTALEVAINDFGRAHNRGKLSQVCGPRLGTDSLKNQIEHLGLTSSVSYLLPLILPEKILPSYVLKGCREAVSIRQNIAHNGQRHVESRKLRDAIENIKKCCQILREYSEDNE